MVCVLCVYSIPKTMIIHLVIFRPFSCHRRLSSVGLSHTHLSPSRETIGCQKLYFIYEHLYFDSSGPCTEPNMTRKSNSNRPTAEQPNGEQCGRLHVQICTESNMSWPISAISHRIIFISFMVPVRAMPVPVHIH